MNICPCCKTSHDSTACPTSARVGSSGLVRQRLTYAAKCPECGKIVRIRPSGGDWLNALYVIRHKSPGGEPCAGHYSREIENHEIIEPNSHG
jgi:hypothetical protein